jgi:hypothetical protein
MLWAGRRLEQIFANWNRPGRRQSAIALRRRQNRKSLNRAFMRKSPKTKSVACKGRAVETVVDGKSGERFLLVAKPTRTFGELAAPAKGTYAGPRDLSAREGFGGRS